MPVQIVAVDILDVAPAIPSIPLHFEHPAPWLCHVPPLPCQVHQRWTAPPISAWYELSERDERGQGRIHRADSHEGERRTWTERTRI